MRTTSQECIGVMLGFAGNVLVCGLLALALLFVVANWTLLIASHKNDANHSLMGGVVQIVVWIAALVSSQLALPWVPGWVFWTVALVDIALYSAVLGMASLIVLALAAPFRRKH